jgi:hypothetical protein
MRGPWLDEFWSLFFITNEKTLHDSFWRHWITDANPPLFSFINFSINKILTISVIEGRLFNFIPLAFAGVYLSALWLVSNRQRGFIFIFSISISYCYYTIFYFVEFRSYFSGMVFFAILLVCLTRLSQDDPLSRWDCILTWAGLIISLGVCLNIHYVTAVMATITVAISAFDQLARGKTRIFLAFALIGVSLASPLIIFAIVQKSFIEQVTSNYWITTTTSDALWIIIRLIAKTVIGNFVLFAAAGLFFAIYFLSIRRQKQEKQQIPAIEIRQAILWMASSLSGATVMLIINFNVPVIQERYMLPLAVLALASASIVAANITVGKKFLVGLLMANGFITVAAAGYYVGSKKHWNASAALINTHISICPGSRIFPVMLDPIYTDDDHAQRQAAFQEMAKKWRFQIQNLNSNATPALHKPCPDLLWVEHFFSSSDYSDAELKLQFVKALPEFRGCQFAIERAGNASGLIAVTSKCEDTP